MDTFEEFSLDLYFQQIEWLGTQGVNVGTEQSSKYEVNHERGAASAVAAAESSCSVQELSKAFRAMLDYAIRNQKDETKINEMFADIRCLNC